MPFSFPIILWSEIGQPVYFHVYMCKNVQQMHTNANVDENGYMSDSFQCKQGMAFF